MFSSLSSSSSAELCSCSPSISSSLQLKYYLKHYTNKIKKNWYIVKNITKAKFVDISETILKRKSYDVYKYDLAILVLTAVPKY